MSKGLTREQLQFARHRLDNWYRNELNKITAATQTVVKTPSLEEVITRIRKGKALVTDYYHKHALETCCAGVAITTVFNIPELEGSRHKVDAKAREEAMTVLNKTHANLESQLVLGDHVAALKIIRSLG